MQNVTITAFLILALCEAGFSQQECFCKKATSNQTSWWGHIANEDQEVQPLKKLYGIVLDASGTTLDESLVEVFADDGTERTPTTPKHKRLAACYTDKSGRFCFNKLKPGKYIVAASRADFNITFVQVALAPKDKTSSSKPLNVELRPGT